MSHTMLEQAWAYMLANFTQFQILTIGTFIIHEVVYFGRYIPFYICDQIPALRKYKIQNDKETTPEMISKCLKSLALTHTFVQLPMMMCFHHAVDILGMKMDLPLPPVWKILSHSIIFLIFEDFWEYWAHRLLHWGPFYKHIHKQHHDFQAPFGIVGEYAHPLEIIILGFGTLIGPLVFAFFNDLHLITIWVYMILRLFQVIDAHSGYDFPWSLRHYLPFWAGADFHDHHHMVFLGNYGTSFRWCDWAFGTDKRYNEWKKTQNKTKKVQ